ncbi:phage tail protein [Vibrio sp. PP-XX7]
MRRTDTPKVRRTFPFPWQLAFSGAQAPAFFSVGLMSNNNDYPLVGYRFSVVIFTAGVPNPVDIYFKEVSGLSMSRSISKQGEMTTLSPDIPMQTLTLKRGVMKDPGLLSIAQALEQVTWGTRLLRKDILVSVLDAQGNPVKAWTVMNAYLESWSWDGVAGDSNEVLVETMSFKYGSLKYLPTVA